MKSSSMINLCMQSEAKIFIFHGKSLSWVWGSFVVAVAIGGGVSVVHAVVKAPEEGVDGSPYGALLSDSGGGGGEYFRV
ncbi:hypothetical protein Leryth_014000 [Lithospermum erythrorhizon]|nr:hypothetical protein Leryth_014000 [Lithospermum erythrorhizon]